MIWYEIGFDVFDFDNVLNRLIIPNNPENVTCNCAWYVCVGRIGSVPDFPGRNIVICEYVSGVSPANFV